MKNFALIVLALACISLAKAQDVTIIRDYGGKSVVSDPSKYKLAGSTEHKVLVQHFELISESKRDQLVDIIIQNIDYYLDQVLVINEGRMSIRKTNQEILSDLEGIVDYNIKLYDYQVDESFSGFSVDFSTKIRNIEQLTWQSEKTLDGSASFDARAMAYNYVQSQISELKNISTRDLSNFAETHVHEFVGDEFPVDLATYPNPIDTGKWEVNSPLTAIDYTLTAINENDVPLLIEPETEATLIPEGTDGKIVELLESNNKLIQLFGEQMIAMQQEMIELRKEGQAYQQEFNTIRFEISDLQLAIEEIRESNNSAVQNPGLRPLGQEKPYTVRFSKNSDQITTEYRMELNEVYHLLMLDPKRKVMITGYADISGNPDLNATISRQRALAVKSYLNKKGVPTARMIVNFLGDSASNSENAADRKVEIAWLAN